MAGRRTAVSLLAVLALVALIPSAQAETAVIKGSHAGTLIRGITEQEFRLTNCSTLPTTTQGLDGHVIDLAGKTYLNLTTLMSPSGLPGPANHSINLIFYRGGSGCDQIFPIYAGLSSSDPTFRRVSYVGATPAGARWVVVSLALGANVTVNWTAS